MTIHATGYGTLVKIVTTTPVVTLELEETDVTPPGVQGNEKIEQTSNRNTAFKSYAPGDLKENTDLAFTAYYDSAKWEDIKSIINVEGVLTLTFKNGAIIGDTSAWLVSALPTGQTINNRPTMDCIISFAGEDAAGVETQSVTP